MARDTRTNGSGDTVDCRYTPINGIDTKWSEVEEAARDVEETAFEDAKPAKLMANIRAKRNALLASTDWTGNSDVTMSDAMTAYRKALRDYPATYAADNEAAIPTLGD